VKAVEVFEIAIQEFDFQSLSDEDLIKAIKKRRNLK